MSKIESGVMAMKAVKLDKVYLDRFSQGLDDMTQRQQRDHTEVLKQLAKMDRFSTFEAAENDHIANTIDFLVAENYIMIEKLTYPWLSVKLTPKGRKVAESKTL